MKPYISPLSTPAELTLKAILLGIVLAVLLGAANAYLGLRVGMTVSASIPAAVLSMGLLRFFRERTILENNMVQTAASAGESLAAGIIFTLPALILMGFWNTFPFWPTFLIALIGGVLGVLFTIPLRRILVVPGTLTYPEGVATAEVLKTGEHADRAGDGLKVLVVSSLLAGGLRLMQAGFQIAAPAAGVGIPAGRAVFGIGTDLGIALVAVGYLVGFNIGAMVFLGGAIGWLVAIPAWMWWAPDPLYTSIVGDATGYDAAFAVWSAEVRYLGVGAMVTGGLWALVTLIPQLVSGFKASRVRLKPTTGANPQLVRTEQDLPLSFVMSGTVAMAIPLFLLLHYLIDAEILHIAIGHYALVIGVTFLFALVAGFLFTSVAGYMAGLVGSSNNPISGITIATVLAVSLLLLALLGGQMALQDPERALAAAATAILVGATVCVAAAIAGDTLQDLKAGHVLGATPWKQQVMQTLGVAAAAVTIAPVLQVLYSAYGIGDVLPRADMDPTQSLMAPQAVLMSSVARGVLGGSLPWGMVALGALLAVGVIAADLALERRQSAFRMPVLAMAVGVYLPLEVSTPLLVGGLVAAWAGKSLLAEPTSKGTLAASGLITGEALVGVMLAIPFAIAQSTGILRLDLHWLSPVFLGLLLWSGLVYYLARSSRT